MCTCVHVYVYNVCTCIIELIYIWCLYYVYCMYVYSCACMWHKYAMCKVVYVQVELDSEKQLKK